jgi:hypothetical protein
MVEKKGAGQFHWGMGILPDGGMGGAAHLPESRFP